MPKVRFVTHEGSEHVVDARADESLMENAKRHDVHGIFADCGGSMSCATCHVYIAPDWVDRVGAASGDEVAMLELAIDPQDNSRLSCQVLVRDDLDGLVVHIPKSQF